MLKKILTGTLAAAALAVTFITATPAPASAELVCQGDWYHRYCYRVHHVRYEPWRYHHHYWHHGYYLYR